jgi:hypothetical protein
VLQQGFSGVVGIAKYAFASAIRNVSPRILMLVFCFSVMGTRSGGMQKRFCKRRDLAERRADSRWQCGLALQRPDTLVRILGPTFGPYYRALLQVDMVNKLQTARFRTSGDCRTAAKRSASMEANV